MKNYPHFIEEEYFFFLTVFFQIQITFHFSQRFFCCHLSLIFSFFIRCLTKKLLYGRYVVSIDTKIICLSGTLYPSIPKFVFWPKPCTHRYRQFFLWSVDTDWSPNPAVSNFWKLMGTRVPLMPTPTQDNKIHRLLNFMAMVH